MKRLLAALFFIIALSSASTAQDAEPWPTAIANVESRLEDYVQRADELLRLEDDFYASINVSPLMYAGNACANCYWPTHQCAILGRMLGKTDFISHLEEPLPPLTAPLGDVWETAQSLSQWVHTAKRLLTKPLEERANIWDLECVGSFGIPTRAYSAVGLGAVNMRVDGTYLWVYGDIEDGFYGELVSFLDQHPEVRTVGLGSAGGSVLDAILSGIEIRKRGLNTQLTGPCLSACPLVFMGGKERGVMRPFPVFGFHQISVNSAPIPFNAPEYDDLRDYALSMGIDGDWIVQKFYSAAPHEMNMQGNTIEERDQICSTGLVTWYQGMGANLC